MPMSSEFQARLSANLPQIAAHFGTPFHIYDEIGIRENGKNLLAAFAGIEGFREYFAVKALPNPHILAILRDVGFGFDCSSIPELILSRQVGARGDDIMFTSNNTTPDEFTAALADGGCILNLDDVTLLDKLMEVGKARRAPTELICFRYNPGARRTGNAIIGKPEEAKFGISHEQFLSAYRTARDLGINRFGLHTMLISNERDYHSMAQTTAMLLELVEQAMHELDITFEFINIGGGLGIPYHPKDAPLDILTLAEDAQSMLAQFKQKHGFAPKLFMESGRYITGAHGVLVTRAINRKDTYRHYIGVDASMSALMRPGMYGAYHHITVFGKENKPTAQVYDVVGSLCENNDKFAVQRSLPKVDDGDLLIIHDTGAHGHAMGFSYNGRLRPKELLLRADGSVALIRRAETIEDYFTTLNFDGDVMEARV